MIQWINEPIMVMEEVPITQVKSLYLTWERMQPDATLEQVFMHPFGLWLMKILEFQTASARSVCQGKRIPPPYPRDPARSLRPQPYFIPTGFAFCLLHFSQNTQKFLAFDSFLGALDIYWSSTFKRLWGLSQQYQQSPCSLPQPPQPASQLDL